MLMAIDICQNTVNAWRIVGYFITIIKIIVPIVIIVTGVVPIFNVIVKGSAEEMSKSIITFGKKLAAGIIVFYVPYIITSSVNILTSAKEDDDIFICTSCFNEPSGEACVYHVNLLKKIEENEIKKFSGESLSGEINTGELNDSTEDGNSTSSGSNSATVENLLKEAKKVTDYARENNFNYGNAPINPAVNHDAKLTSCDRCVGWFLYNIGYDDQPYQNGLTVLPLRDYCASHGFKKITSASHLQAGDIVFINPNASGNPGHVYLLGNNLGNGIWERYDCGSVYRIRLTGQFSSYSSQPFHEPIGSFVYAYRMPNA